MPSRLHEVVAGWGSFQPSTKRPIFDSTPPRVSREILFPLQNTHLRLVVFTETRFLSISIAYTRQILRPSSSACPSGVHLVPSSYSPSCLIFYINSSLLYLSGTIDSNHRQTPWSVDGHTLEIQDVLQSRE